ncbi:protein of unknown function [Taphrina deformans PYCC 5710]|uniref:Retrovirus-related Pol polyprotein from transposon TNT 1-94-like beta-barrel domain-containing protein n=1 Tax=Taphrina deformans (strain PYCC 5710 / ATCC 11124 / CBS 356.35 / IMI 108563 / JCM 9778 / NBRC 8474) TaxID=1097556 RepID=R4XGN1_TAPDE|nr:protein of unknown function [Taphrina deformans PYCC 5710]|eukprot:CCG85052.1 protein of unknown function [Taphrina deformans PYCC 5710]
MSLVSDTSATKLATKLAGGISTHFAAWEINLESRSLTAGCHDEIFDKETASHVEHHVSIRASLRLRINNFERQHHLVLEKAESENVGNDYITSANTEFNKTVYFTPEVGKSTDTRVPVNFGSPDTPTPAYGMNVPGAMPVTSPLTRILEDEADTAFIKDDDVPESSKDSKPAIPRSAKEQKESLELSLLILERKMERSVKLLKVANKCAEVDTKARSTVAFGLQGANLHAVKGLSGRKAYLALRALHKESAVVSRLNAKRELHSLTLKSLDVVAITSFLDEHLRLVSRCQELNPYSTKFTWESMKLDLCYKLPEEFQPLIISIAGAPDSSTSTYGIMVGIIQSRIAAPSYLLKYGSGSKDSRSSAPQNPSTALVIRKKVRSCYTCKSTEHTVWNCTAPGADAKRAEVKAARERARLRDNPQAKSIKPASATPSEDPKAHGAFTVQYAGLISEPNVWILDSGATSHFTHQKDWLADFEDVPHYNVSAAGGHKLTVVGKGKVTIKSDTFSMTLSDVMYCPQIQENLLSTKGIVSKGGDVHIDSSGTTICCNGAVVGFAERVNKLNRVVGETEIVTHSAYLVELPDSQAANYTTDNQFVAYYGNDHHSITNLGPIPLYTTEDSGGMIFQSSPESTTPTSKYPEKLQTKGSALQLKAGGSPSTLFEWHAALGHLSLPNMKKMAKIVDGMENVDFDDISSHHYLLQQPRSLNSSTATFVVLYQ